MEDSDFGILELCREIGVSRTQLHRKVKALTNRSTSNYLKYIRLQKAKELIQEGNLSITEIAYEVGFTAPSYFSKSFTDEFGISPKQFMKTLKG